MRSFLPPASPFAIAATLTSLALMGCSAAASTDAPDAADTTASTATAVVVVERTAGPGDAVRADSVIARFVRVHQGVVDDQALRIAGAAWDLPASGTCAFPSPTSPASTTPAASASGSASSAWDGPSRSIDLLDVGVLTLGNVDAHGQAATPKNTVLLPRTMFDPTGGVSGVFYSGRAADAFTSASRLQLHTSGGADLPEGFAVDVASPRDVTDVRVTSIDPSSQAPGLDVSWYANADGDIDESRDLVYVDVLSPSSHLLARCTTADTGHLVIAGAFEDGQLSVHRLHRESFRTKGIEPGEIRFDVARVVMFRR